MRPLTPINRMLVVNLKDFELTLHRRRPGRMKFNSRDSVKYPVAIGQDLYPTPPGLYLIHGRSDCPEWLMPDSDWVPPEKRGTLVPCTDPDNPIKARWLGIHDGVGIHGTADDLSIGTAASHGCIRMHVEDVKALFPEVPKFTPVLIFGRDENTHPPPGSARH